MTKRISEVRMFTPNETLIFKVGIDDVKSIYKILDDTTNEPMIVIKYTGGVIQTTTGLPTLVTFNR